MNVFIVHTQYADGPDSYQVHATNPGDLANLPGRQVYRRIYERELFGHTDPAQAEQPPSEEAVSKRDSIPAAIAARNVARWIEELKDSVPMSFSDGMLGMPWPIIVAAYIAWLETFREHQ